MTFTSIEFPVFFIIVYCVFWTLNRHVPAKVNLFLLTASYFFYGYWDYRFLFLILLSSFGDYYLAKLIYESEKNTIRKLYLFTSILINLGILGFFKYYNFFISSLNNWFTLGSHSLKIIRIVLPVGISFYTFQTLSYTIDVYRRKLKPSDNLITFFTYVAFFPQLVAGPIERASRILPQFSFPKKKDEIRLTDGMNLILWGLFSKMVIADGAGKLVNIVFSNLESNGFLMLFLGAVLFSIQIYGDFSGYSKIARGIALLLGFDLMQNFNKPYFAKSFGEFWSRWHISLSTWFRDYVYIPLGGNRVILPKYIRNIFVVFVLSGLWHGANWTFVVWGFLHGFFLIIERLVQKCIFDNIALSKIVSYVHRPLFLLAIIMSWVVFRAESLSEVRDFFYYMFNNNIGENMGVGIIQLVIILLLIFIFILFEHLSRNFETPLDRWNKGREGIFIRVFVLFTIYNFGVFETHNFIYFQF